MVPEKEPCAMWMTMKCETGVLAQEEMLEMLDRSRHRQLAASEPRFANTVDAFAGVYDHEQEISLSTPYQVGFNTSYLHVYLRVLL
jgi:hypothetical protein